MVYLPSHLFDKEVGIQKNINIPYTTPDNNGEQYDDIKNRARYLRPIWGILFFLSFFLSFCEVPLPAEWSFPRSLAVLSLVGWLVRWMVPMLFSVDFLYKFLIDQFTHRQSDWDLVAVLPHVQWGSKFLSFCWVAKKKKAKKKRLVIPPTHSLNFLKLIILRVMWWACLLW